VKILVLFQWYISIQLKKLKFIENWTKTIFLILINSMNSYILHICCFEWKCHNLFVFYILSLSLSLSFSLFKWCFLNIWYFMLYTAYMYNILTFERSYPCSIMIYFKRQNKLFLIVIVFIYMFTLYICYTTWWAREWKIIR